MKHKNQKNIEQSPHHLAVMALLFSATSWGLIWYPYRLLNNDGISGLLSSCYTYGLALLLASLYFVKSWRKFRKPHIHLIGLSIFSGWTNIAYILCVLDGEVMRMMLLFYLSPVWTLLLAHFWLKERTNIQGVFIVALALMGVSLMLIDFNSALTLIDFLPIPTNQADWLAISAGVGFAISNVITRKTSHLTITTKAFAVWFGVFLMTLLILCFVKQPILLPSNVSLSSLVLIIMISCMLFAVTIFVQYGVSTLTATQSSVIFLFEIVVAVIASYFLTNERMSWHEWLGGSLILITAILSSHQRV